MSATLDAIGSLTGTAKLLLAGAAAAAALGVQAGAALRPEADERGRAPAPQQLALSGPELANAERAGGGWPARAS